MYVDNRGGMSITLWPFCTCCKVILLAMAPRAYLLRVEPLSLHPPPTHPLCYPKQDMCMLCTDNVVILIEIFSFVTQCPGVYIT